jgi:hypothetical protein
LIPAQPSYWAPGQPNRTERIGTIRKRIEGTGEESRCGKSGAALSRHPLLFGEPRA